MIEYAGFADQQPLYYQFTTENVSSPCFLTHGIVAVIVRLVLMSQHTYLSSSDLPAA